MLGTYKTLIDMFPDIAKEWDYELNIIKPNEISYGSGQKVYWKCPKNHSYIASVYSRTSNYKTGCPYCKNKKILKGFNDLLSTFPDICKEWDYNKNLSEYGLKPDEVSFGSNKKVYWKCNKNHSWQASVKTRTGKDKSGCPYCSNHKLLSGFNDLQTLFPDIAKEYSENNNIPVNQIMSGSNKNVYWECSKGHKWRNSPHSRTSRQTGCAYCCKNQTSKHEQILFDELNHIYQCENRKKHKIDGKLYETDIFIPELNLGIEFNGLYWHQNRIEKDRIKEKQLSSKMNLLYIMEGTENKIIDNKIYFNSKLKYEDNFIWAKNQLLKLIGGI